MCARVYPTPSRLERTEGAHFGGRPAAELNDTDVGYKSPGFQRSSLSYIV